MPALSAQRKIILPVSLWWIVLVVVEAYASVSTFNFGWTVSLGGCSQHESADRDGWIYYVHFVEVLSA